MLLSRHTRLPCVTARAPASFRATQACVIAARQVARPAARRSVCPPNPRDDGSDSTAPSFQEVFPTKFMVECRKFTAELDPVTQRVVCCCPKCDEEQPSITIRKPMTFSAWEKHCGSTNKKWHMSLKIVPGSGLEAMPAGVRPSSITTFLNRRYLKVGKLARSDIEGRLYLEYTEEKAPKQP